MRLDFKLRVYQAEAISLSTLSSLESSRFILLKHFLKQLPRQLKVESVSGRF